MDETKFSESSSKKVHIWRFFPMLETEHSSDSKVSCDIVTHRLAESNSLGCPDYFKNSCQFI